MTDNETVEEAVELLQQLGLKEYEARCFVGLAGLETGTAKQLSEITEVPRTRVYDAIRVLEAHGLVEIQHTSPQQFRAVPLDEATETLRSQYENRVKQLHDVLAAVDVVEDEETSSQEVWTMSGRAAIENRTNRLIESAADEVVLVVGDESLLTDDLVDALNGVADAVDLVLGAITDVLREQVQTAVPAATTFTSGLGWLRGDDAHVEVGIGRLLLVDRSTVLVSSIAPGSMEEQAVFGQGIRNGFVVIARRIMAQGLLPVRDPR